MRVLPDYLPGFVATVALIMINAVRRQAPKPTEAQAKRPDHCHGVRSLAY